MSYFRVPNSDPMYFDGFKALFFVKIRQSIYENAKNFYTSDTGSILI